MPGIGSLIVDIQLRLAEFTQSTKAAKSELKSISDAAVKASDMLKTVFGIGAGFQAVRGLSGLVDEYAKYTAQLKLATAGQAGFLQAQDDVRAIADRSQAALSSIGSLYSRISTAGREFGLEQQKIAEITETVALALKVSGASAEEAGSAILQLSQAFASGKLAGDEFRSISEAAPRLMRALAEGLNVPIGALKQMAADGKLTAEVLARELPKALTALRGEADSINTVSGAVQQLKNRFLELVGTQDDVSGSSKAAADYIKLLANNMDVLKVPIQALIVLGGNFAYTFRTIGIAIVGMKEQLDGFARGGIKGFLESRKLVGQILEDERKKFDVWEKSVLAGGKAIQTFAADSEDAAQGSAMSGVRAARARAEEEAKKNAKGAFQDASQIAEFQSRRLQDLSKRAQEQSNQEIELLQSRLSSGLLAYSEYYAAKEALQQRSLAVQAANTEKEIAILRSVRAKTGDKGKQAGIDSKIEEATNRLQEAQAKVRLDGVKGFLDMQKSSEEYQKKVKDLTASIDELSGKTKEAAQARAELAQEELRREATSRRDEGTIALLDKQKQQLANQAEINSVMQQANIIQDQLAATEERARIAFDTGSAGELTTLQKISEARKFSAAQLLEISKNYTALAAASNNPVIQQQAENFRVQIERLAASSDLVKQKFQEIGESAFATFLTDAISGTKKLSDAFKDMANSILNEVNRLVAADIAKKIFNFGGSSSGTGGSTGGSILGTLAEKVVGLFTGKADGGSVFAGSPLVVGEEGPEIFVPKQNGTIIPNGALAGGNTINISVAVPPGTSRETMLQMSSKMGQQVELALRRNR